jgi:sigma-B regulation protein RsbU (phosphoserine phosphatase)
VTATEAIVRDQLVARRARLAELAASRREAALVDLMRRVDDALAELEVGTWGLCTVCHEPLSAASLAGDPLIRVCLECLSLEERHALERDLEAATRVQRALLPPVELRHDGWEIRYLWEPRSAVSGDHVDIVRPRDGDGPLHLLFGDVVGKGVAAALLQAHLHALFRALATAEASPAELLERANRQFAEATAAASYATFAALRLAADGRVDLANAGHPRPLLADARGVRPVEGGGLPLGLFAGSRYTGHELRLAPGETLLLYTDGWTEAERDGEEYGIGRAAAALRRAARRPLDELLAACRADLEAFLAGAPRSDDFTLLALRRSPIATPG